MEYAVILWGMGGGAVRCVLSLLKAMLDKRKIKLKPFFILLLMNLISGAFLSFLLTDSLPLALAIGYASFDLMDTLNKAVAVKKVTLPIRTTLEKKQSLREEVFSYR